MTINTCVCACAASRACAASTALSERSGDDLRLMAANSNSFGFGSFIALLQQF